MRELSNGRWDRWIIDWTIDGRYVIYLFLADVESQVIDHCGAVYTVDDRKPVWSPDGEWIALRRKVREGAGATQDTN